MINGFFLRLFGKSKNNKNSKLKAINNKKAQTNNSKKQPHATTTSKANTVGDIVKSTDKAVHKVVKLSSDRLIETTVNKPSDAEISHHNQQEQFHLSLDLREKILTPDNIIHDFSSNEDIQEHLSNIYTQQSDEYHTISSIASSSNFSLQDALFSHLSSTTTLDSSFTVASDFTIPPKTEDYKLPSNHHQQSSEWWEQYLSNAYLDALKSLSDNDVVQAYRLFECIALEGQQHVVNVRIKTLVAFAQFRTGLMLWEVGSDPYDYWKMASHNGNLRAIVGLGQLAEQNGQWEEAQQLYYQAKNLKSAKVAYGILLLFKMKKNSQEAIDLLIEASNQGHAIASFALAFHYNLQLDFQQALHYCNHIIDNSHPLYDVAQYQRGIIYLQTNQFKLAIDAFTISNSYPPSLRKLGVLKLLGIGCQRDASIALQLLTQAAKLGDAASKILLGQMYQTGTGVQRDLSRAMQFFSGDSIAARLSRALLIANENPSHAYHEFQHILSVTDDKEDIHHECQLRIALWQYNGIEGVIERNPQESFETMSYLSNIVHYPAAHYWFAWFLIIDQPEKAFEVFMKGARHERPECEYCVGLMLQIRDDHPSAFEFFVRAANHGFPLAMTQVGVYYYVGRHVPKNLDIAFQWFSKAAKLQEPMAIQYMADYLIKGRELENKEEIMRELWKTANEDDPISYRMLALVTQSGLKLPRGDGALGDLYDEIYRQEVNDDSSFQFSLHCLWKAILLNDHASGRYLCESYSRMNQDNILKTIQIFEQVESRVPNKMSLAYGQFLKTCKHKRAALNKFIEVATFNAITTNVGWNARLEASKTVLIDGCGKSRAKHLIFTWLNDMVQFNGKNLFYPLILLGKCHDEEICKGCDKQLAKEYYEKSLQHKSKDIILELETRIKLVRMYYNSYEDEKLRDQLKIMESTSHSKYKAEVYYYSGLLSLHDENSKEKAKDYLIKSQALNNILATLELGYLYGTLPSHEDDADTCFQLVDQSIETPISFKNRLTESMVQMRPHNYPDEFDKMKLAAGITYSNYGMERQAMNWLRELPNHPSAQIMILYYQMKPSQLEELIELVQKLSNHSLDFYGRMAVGYGQFRISQHLNNADYALEACQTLKTLESYDHLSKLVQNTSLDLFPLLYNVARNDTRAIYRLAQYYHQHEGLTKQTADNYLKSKDVPDACYQYAKYRIRLTQLQLNGARHCYRAAYYLRQAADANHAEAYLELAQLELATGLYEEGLEDLREADFLECPEASYRLGEIYRLGFRGRIGDQVMVRIVPNLEIARQYYERASTKLGRALVRLGDLEQSREYYERAVGRSDGEAEYALGCLDNSIEWFERSAKAGYQPAKYKLGSYYLQHHDIEKGLAILEEEAQNGNVSAIKELARYFEKNCDIQRSFGYWRRAELLNDPEALDYIADCFERGHLGQAVSLEDAKLYRQRAIEAREEVPEIQQSMMGFKSDYSEER
ncbi:uncharacterized protein BX663DRAFT_520409 [Cokeromyces recurvatus]|uniref:uncharacterized protein n=1 Tax=Cokeromyces recurvatus TaxID=90255 RepID=UPI00221E5728|nr:uncharacterized protein BX663DRAFT_520409 [Cokeromyces recurvatus]KAI7899783.1 hypothetical protein BX663DRAFT_520409 [Cokeromyces recurvatus]